MYGWYASKGLVWHLQLIIINWLIFINTTFWKSHIPLFSLFPTSHYFLISHIPPLFAPLFPHSMFCPSFPTSKWPCPPLMSNRLSCLIWALGGGGGVRILCKLYQLRSISTLQWHHRFTLIVSSHTCTQIFVDSIVKQRITNYIMSIPLYVQCNWNRKQVMTYMKTTKG